MSNSSGQAAWKATQEPFGKTTVSTFTKSKPVNNLRFPGQYFDAETNLHDNWWRTYDPQIGRYLQSDPIGLGGGLNTYAYALDNPISNIDPTGLDARFCVGSICAPFTAPPPSLPIIPGSAYTPPGPFGPVCGPMGSNLATWIPDSFFFADFSTACQKHDDCYSCSGRSRRSCDDEFCQNLLNACHGRPQCTAAAANYCGQVRENGDQYYNEKGSEQCCEK